VHAPEGAAKRTVDLGPTLRQECGDITITPRCDQPSPHPNPAARTHPDQLPATATLPKASGKMTENHTDFPACYFDALPNCLQARSIFRSTARRGCDPAAGSFIAQTRCLTTTRHPRLLLRRPLPLGAFPPLRIEAFCPIRYRVSPLSESARSPFAPRCRFVLGFGCGSTFQVRYVSVSLLFPFLCSRSGGSLTCTTLRRK
jgi:hypothetical protein